MVWALVLSVLLGKGAYEVRNVQRASAVIFKARCEVDCGFPELSGYLWVSRDLNFPGNIMRTNLAIAAIALLLSSAALAQPANQNGSTPAVNSPNSPPNPGAPVSGANSFTAGQAKSRIESNGFSDVSGLQKDDQGVWRGKAMKDGKSVFVSLDFQGNVTAQ